MAHKMRSKAGGVVALALIITLLTASVASAAYTIYVGSGVSGSKGVAKLHLAASTCIYRIGKVQKYGRDTSYSGRVVYYYFFGTKMSNGKYPLEMYANGSRVVFTFIINGSGYVTAKGINVGDTETTLKRAYGSSLARYPGSVYTRYTLKTRTTSNTGKYHYHYTDFYVKTGRVRKIVVRAS